jgi:hypothetical protein
MAKPSKVQSSSDESGSESEEEDFSKEELLDMLHDTHSYFKKKVRECKVLTKEKKLLEQSFEELSASHECLKEDHEALKEAHSKLEKAYSSLSELAKVEDVPTTCDVGVHYDLFDTSIVIASTNTSCSTSTSTSPKFVSVTCDAKIMDENKNLKKEVHELTLALGNAYGGDAHLLKCLGSQRFSINKKGKAAFVPHKTTFVKGNSVVCYSCKQVGHKEQYCKKRMMKQSKPMVSSIRLDSCYVLTKGARGVRVKFIGAPKENPKKKAIWVPKSLVTNLQGPKQTWVPKSN